MSLLVLDAVPKISCCMEGVEFPLFRARYLAPIDPDPKQLKAGARALNIVPLNTSMQNAPTPAGRLNLKLLDLRALPQPEDEGQSESAQRRNKLAFFEKHCSHILNGIYVSGEYPAKHREVLSEHGITHIINCVGFLYGELFKNDGIQYKTYFLMDAPCEDITCVLYDAFDFITAALASKGRVLVHCSQGVSRSATIVIAYLMWSLGKGYDETFGLVKGARGVCSPNIGFCCQLLQWHRKRTAPHTQPRIYRIAPHNNHAPLFLVPKVVSISSSSAAAAGGTPQQGPARLDPRGAFLVHTAAGALYVWRGRECPEAFARAAEAAAAQLQRYEEPGAQLVHVQQGEEPPELLAAFQPPSPAAAPQRASSSNSSSLSPQPSQQLRRASLTPRPAPLASERSSDCEMGEAGRSAVPEPPPPPRRRSLTPSPPPALASECSGDCDMGTCEAAGGGLSQRQRRLSVSEQRVLVPERASEEAEDMEITPAPWRPPASGALPSPAFGPPLPIGHLQPPQPPQQRGLIPAARSPSPSSGWSSGSSQQGAPLAAEGSSRSAAAADADGGSALASARSTGLAAGLLVEEVDEYSEDYLLFYKAFLHSGGRSKSAAGSGTPRGLAAAALSADDSAARPASPATNEGRHRKYRRSETERHISTRPSRASQLSMPPLQLPFLAEQQQQQQEQGRS